MHRKRLLVSTVLTTVSIIIIVLALVVSGFAFAHPGLSNFFNFGGQVASQNNAISKTPTPTPTIPASAQITSDFGSRLSTKYPISNQFLGMNAGNFLGTIDQASSYLHQANFQQIRMATDFPTIFPTPASATDPTQQSWFGFDQQLQRIIQQGFHPILTLAYSPTWMQPQNQNPAQPNYCLLSSDPRAQTFPSHVKPAYMVNGVDKGIAKWALMAAQVVAHMDKTYPKLNPYYEIWNEPDGVRYMCTANNDPNPQNTKWTYYRPIYAAAAPQMKAQAQKDNMSIKVGGPALAYPRGHSKFWFPLFVNEPTIAPYIDFISYHQYSAADTWDGTKPALLTLMQVPPFSVANQYEYISSVIHAGKQPNAKTTPIYIDEFNTDDTATHCCRYNATYGPLWTSLFVADMLNSVNDTGAQYGPALAVPSAILYYAQSSSTDGFCLLGDPIRMNCAVTSNMKPYPPYYALDLLCGSNYLGITNGGYVAGPATTNAPGIVISDVYTSSKDDILIVNSSGHSYTQVTVFVQNPGSIQTTASLYTLNQANPTIGSQQVTLSSTGNGGYKVTISLPADSTVALSMAA